MWKPFLTPRPSSVSNEVVKARILVWPWYLRIFHWLLAASVLGAWLTRDWRGSWHENSGYLAVTLTVLRIIWGKADRNPFVRFDGFVQSPQQVLAYTRQLFHGTPPRYPGHNPLGGWMIVVLLAGVSLLGITGWLYTTDMFWGDGWLASLHAAIGMTLIGCIGLHVSGSIFSGWKHQENLIAAMIHGHKRPADETGTTTRKD